MTTTTPTAIELVASLCVSIALAQATIEAGHDARPHLERANRCIESLRVQLAGLEAAAEEVRRG